MMRVCVHVLCMCMNAKHFKNFCTSMSRSSHCSSSFFKVKILLLIHNIALAILLCCFCASKILAHVVSLYYCRTEQELILLWLLMMLLRPLLLVHGLKKLCIVLFVGQIGALQVIIQYYAETSGSHLCIKLVSFT